MFQHFDDSIITINVIKFQTYKYIYFFKVFFLNYLKIFNFKIDKKYINLLRRDF